MITLLQRVSEARVEVDAATIGSIKQGILVLVGVQSEDDESTAQGFVERLLNYRVFSDADGKMNLSLIDIDGGLLLVPQFTLAANTKKGRRPSFTSAAPPQHGKNIFETMVAYAGSVHETVACGQFGADMQVSLTNDGPVTFILD
ncbi:MAG: D-tyrosyl-tRNA(Tyr) deacylase [Gammaproteobacteria bacterium]|nr:D-tyrosyl-tRNA(Tyr) deacylase [Gammaproteobacteria bacterium]